MSEVWNSSTAFPTYQGVKHRPRSFSETNFTRSIGQRSLRKRSQLKPTRMDSRNFSSNSSCVGDVRSAMYRSPCVVLQIVQKMGHQAHCSRKILDDQQFALMAPTGTFAISSLYATLKLHGTTRPKGRVRNPSLPRHKREPSDAAMPKYQEGQAHALALALPESPCHT